MDVASTDIALPLTGYKSLTKNLGDDSTGASFFKVNSTELEHTLLYCLVFPRT